MTWRVWNLGMILDFPLEVLSKSTQKIIRYLMRCNIIQYIIAIFSRHNRSIQMLTPQYYCTELKIKCHKRARFLKFIHKTTPSSKVVYIRFHIISYLHKWFTRNILNGNQHLKNWEILWYRWNTILKHWIKDFYKSIK